MINNKNKEIIPTELKYDEEIDLSTILNILIRNKFLIFKITILIFLLSCFYALIQKRVWQGQFEIVLEETNKRLGGNSALLKNLTQFNLLDGYNNNSLETEVGVLRSQSVLMPIFNFVKQQNSNNKIPYYGTWEKNLNINLKKKTSILKISYKDKNKEIIIPVLEKISQTYQDYSGLKKRRSIELTKIYLKSQISIFSKKSKESKKIALNFAIDQNLNVKDIDRKNSQLTNFINQFDIVNSIDFNGIENTNNFNNSLESNRVNLANEIKETDYQIKKINNLKNINDLQYIGSTIKPLVEQKLPQLLEKTENELVELRSKYTEDDVSIKKLIKRRNFYAELLKKRAIGYLKARRIALEAKLEAVKRPKGVIVKGKELLRTANRDERTLVDLENNLRNIELMESRIEDPWKLITNPTLSPNPIYPHRSKIALIGLISGLIFGSAYSYVKEKTSKLIFEEKELENLLCIPIFKRININQKSKKESNKELKFEELENLTQNKVNLVLLSNDNETSVKDKFERSLSNLSKNKYNLIPRIKNLSNNNPDDLYFIVLSLGNVTYPEIADFKKRLSILEIKLRGIILI